ncbi:hypothetical protein BH20ACI2_BH20ACI2_17040 [soil metagenome]
MLNNGNKDGCGRSDEIVAYIYKEIEADKSIGFETHLAGCESCTDEFAAVSDARFSVFEWHKEEFSPLPTPEFSIPYVAKTEVSAGFFTAIGEMIRNSGWPATVAATLAVCVGLGFAMMMLVGSGGNEIARVEVDGGSVQANNPSPVTELPRPTVVGDPDLPEPARISTVAVGTSAPKRLNKNTKPSLPKTRVTPPRSNALPIMSKAPVLSSYEDIEDRSLRLSDILDEAGG